MMPDLKVPRLHELTPEQLVKLEQRLERLERILDLVIAHLGHTSLEMKVAAMQKEAKED